MADKHSTYRPPAHILPIIVISQLVCTSPWFAGNAVIDALVADLDISGNPTSHLTSAVQFGFILGTLVNALTNLADRFSPSRVFFISALLAAASNLGLLIGGMGFSAMLIMRFLTGYFLAGIYPVGMKISSDYTLGGLGKWLGYLVGALVLGKAFPFLLKGLSADLPWEFVIISTSIASALGGVALLVLVPDGPYHKKREAMHLKAAFTVFKNPKFRSAAFGYFGHMWELYTFWAFVPVVLSYALEQLSPIEIANYSSLIIGIGGLSCVAGGYASQRIGPKSVAKLALWTSGVCCLVSPIFLFSNHMIITICFFAIWGIAVIMDSPMFSTLVAGNCPQHEKATALTIVNCIGFSITIISLQALGVLTAHIPIEYILVVLAIGPAFGLYSLYFIGKKSRLDTPRNT